MATVLGLDGRKMSKSYGNTLGIFADPAEVKKKIMSIPTDSTPLEEPKDPDSNPVLSWFRQVAPAEAAAEMEGKLRAGGYGWGHAKKELVQAFLDHFAPARARREEIAKDLPGLARTMARGAEKARAIHLPILESVRRAVGVKYL